MNEAHQKKPDTGLTSQEVAERVAAGQVNGDMDVKTKSYGRIFRDNLFTLFNLVNVILFVCILISGSYRNGLFFMVVIWNFIIGSVQEIRAKKTIDRLSLLTAPKVFVLRDGKIANIHSREIVLGDVMQLKTGYQVCADSVVLRGECTVNESLLTGESTPIVKKPGDHLLSGSFIISGSVLAEAEHVGADNYVSKITLGAKYVKKSNSVIMSSVKYVVRIVVLCLVPLAGLMVWKNFFLIEQSFPDAMVAVVASVSAMIPGGLVLLVSIVMAVSVVRLSRHNTLAQDLYCVENLARVDVVCLDKTGTITEGKLRTEEIIPLEHYNEDDVRTFAVMMEDENATIEAVRDYLYISPEERAEASADAMGWRSVAFSSETKRSMLYNEYSGTLILGAWEFICPELRGSELEAQMEEYESRAKRVLLFAKSSGVPSDDGKTLPPDVRPVALIVMADQVKADARETLDYFDMEEVELKVISGDNPVTVSVVAEEAGLDGADRYVDATTLTSYEDIEKAVEEYTILGRVTPYQKLDIIKALKAHGHTVAMVGDGANDVLALKEADCSIAMQNGADAARNVANMVLLDSNFHSLPFIVAEGRRSINNLQRSAGLYLTKTTYAILLTVFFLFVSFAYPFQSIQVTLIGAVTIGIPSFFLALEPNHQRVQSHFLRNVFRMAVPSGAMTAAAIIATVLFARRFLPDIHTEEIETIATYVAILVGFIVIFDICGKLNLWKGGMLTGLILIAAVSAGFPFFRNIFCFTKLTMNEWLFILIASGIFFVIHAAIYRFWIPARAAKVEAKLEARRQERLAEREARRKARREEKGDTVAGKLSERWQERHENRKERIDNWKDRISR